MTAAVPERPAGGPRILVGQLWQESHSFNPQPTGLADFTVELGDRLVAANREAGSALGGLLRAGEAAGVAWLPVLAARARPGGPVEEPLFAGFLEAFLEAARRERPDAVCLELHGALLTTARDDPEGDLLAALRAALGPAVPIAAALDLHADLTPAMVAAADLLVAYKTNPHADMAETGARTMSLLLDRLAGRLAPVRALVKLPFLTRGNDETGRGPLHDLHALARRSGERRPALRDVSICNVNPFVDAPGAGQAVLVTADGDARTAEAVARDLAERLWAARDLFVERLPSVEETLARVRTERDRRPFVLGDQGDRVLAGAPGDSPALLRALLDCAPDLRAALPIVDPEAVARCTAAGEGATLGLEVGGRITPGFAPLAVEGRVERLGPGRFVNRGPYMAGVPVELGDTAVLAVGQVRVLLTSRAGLVQDPEAYESHGILLKDLDLLVAKSANHYKLSFAGLATPVTVDSPGLSRFAPRELPFAKARPLHPIDAVDPLPLAVSLFS
ncbi:MAG: M81 family metallopeptidase [Tistlia sp.]|uniref:M81 family metallopeptidase n=1 Tax=Tistlia sp. TaxID=3057121 RepID=UPI0034A28840